MSILKRFEQVVADWLKTAPRMPRFMQRRLAGYAWIAAAIFAIACAVGALGDLFALPGRLSALDTLNGANYDAEVHAARAVLATAVSLVVNAASALLLGLSVTPLRSMQKTGWYYAFAALIVGALGVAIGAVLTLSVIGFITKLLFGAIGVTILAYLLFETRSHFMHTERSKGARRPS